MITLEQILTKEKARRYEGGKFGINACKECIEMDVKFYNKTLYQLLEEYVDRANKDMFFNRAMILACWELINKED